MTNTVWGGAPTAWEADSLSPLERGRRGQDPGASRGPQALLTIRFVLDDDPDDDLDDDLDDDEFGDDEEGADEEDEEDDDEDDDEEPDTETWQVSLFSRGAAKGWLPLTSGGELPRLAPISQLN